MAFGTTITVPTVTGSHDDFSAVIICDGTRNDLPSGAFNGANEILNGGGNLRAYTSSAKTTQLPVEIVAFVTGATPIVEVWVSLPSGNPMVTSATIYIEADSVETSQPAVTNAFGRNAVWSGFEAVYHFATLGGVTDATGNGHDLTEFGSPTLVAGMLGSAVDLDNVNDYYVAATNPRGDQSFTQTAVLMARPSATNSFIADDGDSTDGGFQSFVTAAGELRTRLDDSGANGGVVDTATNLEDSVFRVIHIDCDKTSNLQHYLNGVADGAALDISAYGDISPTGTLTVGNKFGGITADRYDGQIDEYRISLNLPSSDWKLTEYDNQSATTAWYTNDGWAVAAAGGLSSSLMILGVGF
jgi:hypothetical protein